MKLWMRRIHLVVAGLLAAFLLCLCITGVILVYAKDIQRWYHPDYWLIAEDSQQSIDLSTLVNRLQQRSGQSLSSIEPGAEQGFAWQVRLKDGQYLSVNPYTAEVLLAYEYDTTLYGLVLELHRWLLYQDQQGEKPLRVWVSIAALGLIIELLLGLYLWLRPKYPLKRLKVNFRAKPKVWLFQLHTLLGVLSFLPLLLIAFSGMTFNWSNVTAKIVETVTLGEIETRPSAPVVSPQATYSWQTALTNAEKYWPTAKLYRIYMPADNTDSIDFRLRQLGESHAYSWLWVNPYNGDILQAYDATAAGVTSQVWNFRYKFHIGAFAGNWVQTLWVIVVSLPLFFLGSGVYLWYRRHNRVATM